MKWQAIETAPRDGTHILAGEYSPGVTGFEAIQTLFYDDQWWLFPFLEIAWEPTHWMPLPDPPKDN